VLRNIYDASWDKKQSVIDLMDQRQRRLGNRTPRQAFNAAVANDNDLKGVVNNRLKPLLTDTEKQLSKVFNSVAKSSREGRNPGLVTSFQQYFSSKKMNAFREKLNDLPFA